MAEKLIRIGKVSSIDHENGMISVTYPDMDDSTTNKFPTFSFTDEYKMPEIGDEVLVLHLSNGQSAGVVMGKFWNRANKPECDKATYKKELGERQGEAYIRYKDGEITLKDRRSIMNLGETLDRISALEDKIKEIETRL